MGSSARLNLELKKDGCEMFNLIEQNIAEARASFTRTLKRMARGEKIVVFVRKRSGDLHGAIIPAAEALRYLQWRAEQLLAGRAQTDDSELLEEAQGLSQSDDVSLSLPEGWYTPKEYARKCLAERHSPEAVFRGLRSNYGEHGLSDEAAARIVVRLRREQGED